jgi:hypothetical protein
MHQLDEWMHYRFHAISSYRRMTRQQKGEIGYVRYVRYADDFVRHEARYVHGARAPTIGRRVVSLSP